MVNTDSSGRVPQACIATSHSRVTKKPPKGPTKTAKPFGMHDSRNSSSNQPCRRYCSTFVGPRDTRKPSMASKTALFRKHAWLAWWGQDLWNVYSIPAILKSPQELQAFSKWHQVTVLSTRTLTSLTIVHSALSHDQVRGVLENVWPHVVHEVLQSILADDCDQIVLEN